jgi:caffeoyl-CoA O-methyltransferase
MLNLCLSIFLFPLLTGSGYSVSEPDSAIFQGIDDRLVLPLLQTLYEKPGRWNVPPQDGRFLYDLVLEKGFKRGLEIGTSNGYSTLWLGLALHKTGGKIITIEFDRDRVIEARENFRAAQLEKIIDSRLNDAFREMPKLKGPFDFVFLDARKGENKKYLDFILPKISVGGAIIAHNVHEGNARMDNFLWSLKTNKSLETKLFPASQSGMSVSIKLKE